LVAGPAEDWPRIKIESALNRGFKDWNQVFPNATCIATLLDRLTHHADIAIIEGKSYRVRESELESTARRKASAPDSKSVGGS
jgi:IstB-like ATP binding protein